MRDSEEFIKATIGAMDLIYNIAHRATPSVEDARDLVQETYLAAFTAWTKHRRPNRVEPWLATICLNLARSGYRYRARRPREVPLGSAASIADSSDPERAAIASVEAAALHRAMWSLDEGQRIALTLVDLGGLSTTEAAHAMGTPRGTVLSRLHRGRRALALLLGDQIQEREA